MSEICLNGLCYRFNDDFNLFEFLDAHADCTYEEGHKPVAEINNSHIQEIHYMGIVFQFADGFSLMALLDENADEVSENKSGD